MRITTDDRDISIVRVDYGKQWAAGRMYGKYSLRLMDAPTKGKSVAAWKFSFTTGCYVIGVALNFGDKTVRHTELRFYRRGHGTIIVSEGERVKRLKWMKAPTALERERAIDTLLAPPIWISFQSPSVWALAPIFDSLADERGPALFTNIVEPSEVSREACLLGAREYRDLAGTPLCDDVVKLRVLNKAEYLEKSTEAPSD